MKDISDNWGCIAALIVVFVLPELFAILGPIGTVICVLIICVTFIFSKKKKGRSE